MDFSKKKWSKMSGFEVRWPKPYLTYNWMVKNGLFQKKKRWRQYITTGDKQMIWPEWLPWFPSTARMRNHLHSRTRRTPLLGQLFMPVRKKVQIDKKNCLTTSFIFGESTLSGSILEVV
jgi:hypothetical protein